MSLLADRVVGTHVTVPVLAGERRYVNLDHAASTPPFASVLEAINAFAPKYANVHRGTGYKSKYSSQAYEEAREVVLRFLGADPAHAVAVFSRNTTEALNHLAERWPFRADDSVITTMMEHHSNDLPWRRVARVIHVGLDATGRVDEAALHAALAANRGRIALLAVAGASNVTGIVNPIHRWAAWAHEAGARIVVDGAQLVPHRPLDVRPPDDPEHLDFAAFSAHKMYAPFGTGVLIGPRAFFARGEPRLVGGGTVDIVSLERAVWTAAPEREEAGTPCIIGAIALAAAIREYETIGWDDIIDHETHLTRALLERFAAIPGIQVYGDADPANAAARLGVVPFNLAGRTHEAVAELLGDEFGIGTRSGCFCAHPYVKSLLGIDAQASLELEARIVAGDQDNLPGMVRASIGLTTTPDDIEALGCALEAIATRA